MPRIRKSFRNDNKYPPINQIQNIYLNKNMKYNIITCCFFNNAALAISKTFLNNFFCCNPCFISCAGYYKTQDLTYLGLFSNDFFRKIFQISSRSV